MVSLLLGMAMAQDLAAIAEREGLPAAHQALEQIVSTAKNDKKLQKALEDTRIDAVEVPAKAGFGADFVLMSVQPMTACHWENGLVCELSADTASRVEEGEFEVRCRSKYRATAEIEAELLTATDSKATWQIRQADKCWAMNGAQLILLPMAHDDLEGIGTGDDDLIPPELAGLTWGQVESMLMDQMPVFKACVKTDGEGSTAVGKLVVGFHIAEDGSIDRAEAELSGLSNPDAEACILERFKRVKFPPPNDGFTEGSFPFTFQ